MAKGGRREGAGRPAGTGNKDLKLAREAIAKFVDGNADMLEGWLRDIAADSPKDAFNCFMSVVEYHIPKLQRTENNTNLNGSLNLSGEVTFVNSKVTDSDSV